ncbi:MAG: aminopeptidase P N-terminal domain-containing protein [Gemmatimonadota bacterium]
MEAKLWRTGTWTRSSSGWWSAAGALPAREAAAQETAPPNIPTGEYAARRARILAVLPDGILLLHARSTAKTMAEWGFVQDPSFLYFTGLADLPGAILALDGPRKEVRLFVPPVPTSFGFPVEGRVPAPGEGAARDTGLDAVRPWTEFASYVETRLAEGARTLYVDEPRRPEAAGVPPGFRPAAGPLALWRTTLEERATAAALRAVARRLRPGLTQREAESAVVGACLAHGAQGPSFWPWIMTGPNAHVRGLVQAFFRYDQLNRVMRSGELARVDIGCAGGLYGADVGRTLPVSGRFSPGQREAWNLLIRGYRAGMEAMSAGVALEAVGAASAAAVLEARSDLDTSTGREAADALLSGGEGVWHIHGVGIESGEDAGPVLEAGSVIAFEPMIEVGPDAFYLEDMILITPEGYEVLSAGLPYTAREIEAAMRPEPVR